MTRWLQRYAVFSALTASSQLTALHIKQAAAEPLPEAKAIQHIFPEGKVFGNLRVLCLERWTTYTAGQDCIDINNFTDIMRCCPALQRLSLVNVSPDTLMVTETNIDRCLEVLPTTIQSLGFTPNTISCVLCQELGPFAEPARSQVQLLRGQLPRGVDCADRTDKSTGQDGPVR